MGRPAKNHESSRLTLDLPMEIRELIEKIRDETQVDSLTSVIKSAVKLYDYFLEEKKKDHKIFVQDETSERELIFFV
jgi:hypothetical protein